MQEGLIKQLLEAGVHFGHQTKRWNPKMKKYIFGHRSGIYIIDLEKTQQLLLNACNFLKEVTQDGGHILFVGTKKQAQEIIISEATRCGMFYVNKRWLGGMLTNFSTIRKSIERLKELTALVESEDFKSLTKKEVASVTKEIEKLKRNLAGIAEMDKLPQALFVIDPKREATAVYEATKLSIPIVALIDTNCDPDIVDYPIPGNDDAIKSIKLLTSIVADSIQEGRKQFMEGKKEVKEQLSPEIEPQEEIPIEEVEKIAEAIEEKVQPVKEIEKPAKLLKKKVPKQKE